MSCYGFKTLCNLLKYYLNAKLCIRKKGSYLIVASYSYKKKFKGVFISKSKVSAISLFSYILHINE